MVVVFVANANCPGIWLFLIARATVRSWVGRISMTGKHTAGTGGRSNRPDRSFTLTSLARPPAFLNIVNQLGVQFLRRSRPFIDQHKYLGRGHFQWTVSERGAAHPLDPGSSATRSTSIFIASWRASPQRQAHRKRSRKAARLLPRTKKTI